jgi:hypothetical protein
LPVRGGAAKPDAVYPAGGGKPRSIRTHVALLAGGLVAVGVVAWILAGVVFALLHIIELLVVAGVAGWAGYRFGLFRGRHQGH